MYKTLWIAIFAAAPLLSEEPIGIIGGQGNAPYAALLFDEGLKPVEGLPPTGLTFRVGINAFGTGLIGGTDGVNAYAAYVTPAGTALPIQGLMAPGEIYSVSINAGGVGLIGGGHAASNVPYAAAVFENGSVTPFSVPSSGLIYGVAIDDSGSGIIGGAGPLGSAYAAITQSSGSMTPLSGLPAIGTIFWVSTNSAQERLIGGVEGLEAYAAFVSPDNTVMPIEGLPLGQNYSVAINRNGNGIMGGTSLNAPFAALVDRTGTAFIVPGLPQTAGIIYNVALNDSGTGLLAGFSASGPYGAFLTPAGSLIPFKGLPSGPGFLDGAALHPAGIALVGGTSSGTPFAALVAPNGRLTYLNSGLPPTGQINSTAFSLLDALVPKSIGPFDSYANTQFTLADALADHSIVQNRDCFRDPCATEQPLTLWMSFAGNFLWQKSRGEIPAFSNQIGGVLLGLDSHHSHGVVFGGALAYAENSVRTHRHLGKADINQESAVLYATLDRPFFYASAALWGGAFQGNHKRYSILGITSKAKPEGWTVMPHLEFSSPFILNAPDACAGITLDSFIALDYANSWQRRFREKGSSGFNIQLQNTHAGVFRTELGLRMYETLFYPWGRLLLGEKLSYVNKTPIGKRRAEAHFIGAFSRFDAAICSARTEDLGRAELHMEWIPHCMDTYASFDYQGTVGKRFWSHMLTLSMGINY